MTDARTTVRTSIRLKLTPTEAFDSFVEEIAAVLGQSGMQLETGPSGKIVQDGFTVARILSWQPGKGILFEWHQASWQPDEVTEVEFRFEPTEGGVDLMLEHRGWGGQVGEQREISGWFASEIAAPFLSATAPARFGDWITDRRARRPSGSQSRGVYRDPLFHYPNFRVILSELSLKSTDYLLEVGCGGGAFLKDALKSGCRAAGIDHSPDMVQLSRIENRAAIEAGKLQILEVGADRLPFSESTFTCALMTGVFGFLSDPVTALAEIRRVLQKNGRLIVMGSDLRWKGTPAAPEPIASRLHFYRDDEFSALAHRAGFGNARVVHREMETSAREVGIPAEALPLFAGPGVPFLIATKD